MNVKVEDLLVLVGERIRELRLREILAQTVWRRGVVSRLRL